MIIDLLKSSLSIKVVNWNRSGTPIIRNRLSLSHIAVMRCLSKTQGIALCYWCKRVSAWWRRHCVNIKRNHL